MKNTYKDEEIEDKHEVLDAAETVPLHGCPPCRSLSLPLGGEHKKCHLINPAKCQQYSYSPAI